MRRAAALPLLLVSLALLSLSCALPCAQAQTLLASADGYSIKTPLRLQGVDVGSTLTRMNARVLRHQALIDELMRRNGSNTALLQHYEQTFEQLQQTINNQQTRIDAQETRIEQLKANSTLRLPGGGSSSVVQIVTQQQTVIDRLIERNSTVQRELDGVGEKIEKLGDKDVQLAQQIQQLNNSLTTRIDAHDTQISQLNSKVDALLTPTIVHAVAGSEQATVQWALASTTVTASPGGATCGTDGLGGLQQCTVLGLSNGVNYTFTARLTNAAGLGHVSPRSNEVMPLGPCRALTVATAGDGGVVTASPASSAYCPAGEYTAGTLVTLSAISDAGFGVSWAGPPSGVAGAALLTFALRMPDAAETVVAAFAQCFTLTVGVLAGAGSAVIAAPSNTPGCAAGSFVAGASVTLKATPAAGWSFSGWAGTVSAGFGTAVWSFVMPASAATQRASFTQCLPLTVSRQPADGSGGSVSLSPSNSAGCPPGRFLVGAALTLTASPAAGWGFAGWAGTLTSSAAVWSYTMGSAAAVQTAQFGQCFPLTLTATGPAGSAASASLPNSYGCAAGSYASGAPLSLSATVPSGATFLRWSGSGASGTTSPLSYTMPAAAASVTAQIGTFTTCRRLTLVSAGCGAVDTPGPVSADCPAGQYAEGSSITVRATADATCTLSQWSGDSSSTTATLSFTIPNRDATLQANFLQCYQMTVSLVNPGPSGVISQTPRSLACSSLWYVAGATVTLSGAASDGTSTFREWSGDATGTAGTIAFTMPAGPATITANFLPCVQVTTASTGSPGTVSVVSGWPHTCTLMRFPASAPITATPVPNVGVSFKQWSGTYSGTSNPLAFTMPATPVTLSAAFGPAATCRTLSLVAAGCGTIGAPSPSTDCPAGQFAVGASITITATASSTCTFSDWSGDAVSASATLSFTIPSSDATLQANFKQCYKLILDWSGAGTIIGSPSKSLACTPSWYVAGAVVTVTASGAYAATFRDFSSDASGTTSPLAFTMPARQATVMANFIPCVDIFISIVRYGAAGGTSTKTTTWSHTCGGRFPLGAPMTVTAVPNADTTFTGWTGPLSSYTNVLNFTMPASAPTLTGSFYLCSPLSIGVKLVGGATGSVNAPTTTWNHTCPAGQFPQRAPVTVEAVPGPLSTFVRWSDNYPINPHSITMMESPPFWFNATFQPI